LSELVEGWGRTLSVLSPTAYQLIDIITKTKHLTRDQYSKLIHAGPDYESAVMQLRRRGILVPLSAPDVPRRQQPVYWLPPGQSGAIRAAIELTPRDNPVERTAVRGVLTNIGYLGPGEGPSRRPRAAPPVADREDDEPGNGDEPPDVSLSGDR